MDLQSLPSHSLKKDISIIYEIFLFYIKISNIKTQIYANAQGTKCRTSC